ncbi:MAG: transcription-repair coupling factor [Gammaproteobacteria bacterium]|nr:MAG: transcription-repair coupling factor [Gammaproteobacteria bacterium]
MNNYVDLDLPEISVESHRLNRWGQLYGSSYGLVLLQAARQIEKPLLVITSGSQVLDELLDQLSFFGEQDDLPVLAFPDWETLPYDAFSPHQDIVSQRLETLYKLPGLKHGLIATTVTTLMQRLAPVDYVNSRALILQTGKQLDLQQFRKQLDDAGYICVPQVAEHGEFAIRGSLIDLFPAGNTQPFRIDLFDDEIETIRTFDPDTQRTIDKTDHIRLLPAREFPLYKEDIDRFRQSFRREFAGNPKECPIYNDISDGIASVGAEYYLPLFFEQTATLFDYLPDNMILASIDEALSGAGDFYNQVEERYEQLRHDITRPILTPDKLFLTASELVSECEQLTRLELQHYAFEQEDEYAHNFSSSPITEVRINARAEKPALLLSQFLDNFDGRALITTESPGQREMLLDLLRGFNIRPHVIASWIEFLKTTESLCITVAPLTEGMLFKQRGIAIITDQQILGQRTRQISSRRRQRREAQAVFTDLGELLPDSPVVHEDHGVGRYQGLQILEVNGYKEEFLTLEYADNNKLYVPVASLHLINRYTGGPDETAPLHRLGGEQWQKIKRKAIEKVHDVAAELLDIYARRKAKPGYAFQMEPHEYEAFVESFPFEETEDQANAIDAVIQDMQSSQPMDRVVCGDVGFGKTEVAMRAAFVATQSGKQVAILSPTTLLAQQHFQNFRDRFADWPVRVEVLSRFRTKKETDEVLSHLTKGTVDIVIGTHKLIQDDVKFKDLGLIVIDEEHRFGVRQKEKLKKLRSQVDMLTLTATPIPRTLNMSLSGLRDLSIIATPPMQRLSVKTFVNEWREVLVQEACLREIKRGGQVYFLHNKVETIEKTANEIRKLIPQARVEVAHGQMRELELEQVMLDFYHRRFNVLVCTTIIESGIDVPTANTIVMNRADKLGLAQLHQLRGRVGRSHHQAYAYLIVPPRKAMTIDAIKRVEAVESLEDLGAGFSLATHDLEIRGAGELLGDEQSGQISEIGFSLYTDMLERAVNALKSGKIPELDQPLEHGPEVEMRLPALLPDDYLPDVHTRLIMYKRIASAPNQDALRELQVEMIDRFGLLPDQAKTLFHVSRLKLQATHIGIKKIEASDSGGRIVFNDNPNIDPMSIIHLIQNQPETYRFDGKNTLRFNQDLPDEPSRFDMVEQLLTRFTLKNAA